MQLGSGLPIPAQAAELRYEVYALDNSVRTAWLDAQRGFFNGTSLCLRVHGQERRPMRWSWWPQAAPDWGGHRPDAG
jgi:predicted metalloprotease with PDZ domain